MDDLPPSALHARYDEVLQFVRRHAPSEDEAEEITQSVFAQAAARLDAAGSSSPPPIGWLYTVARRRLIDAARRRQRRGTAVPLREDLEVAAEHRYGAEVARALRTALAGLPPPQREVVILRLVAGRPFAEIAARLETTEAACKMRFLRGLASVKETFEKEGIEP
jgi:RNA polymerase sigma-70 factor, ECF subfamily